MNNNLKKIIYSCLGIFAAIFIASCSCGGPKQHTKDGKLNPDYYNFNNPQSYIDAVNENDFDFAHKVLNHLYARYLKDSFRGEEYWKAAQHVYKAEMQWLIPQNDPEANKRLIFTLDNMNPIGTEPVPDTKYDNDYDADKYVDFADEYNKLCLEIIRVAVHNNNFEMAEAIVPIIKTSYTKQGIGEKNWGGTYDDGYIFKKNETAKEQAIKLISEYKNTTLMSSKTDDASGTEEN